MFADVHFPAEKQVDTKKKGHHVGRRPFSCPKTSEHQKKKMSSRPQVVVTALKLSKIFRGRMI